MFSQFAFGSAAGAWAVCAVLDFALGHTELGVLGLVCIAAVSFLAFLNAQEYTK